MDSFGPQKWKIKIVWSLYDAYVGPVKKTAFQAVVKLPIRPIEIIFFKTALDLDNDDDQNMFEHNLLR